MVTCKNYLVNSVNRACADAGLEQPTLFNIGFNDNRKGRFFGIMGDIRDTLDQGEDVVVHCHAGVHRAAQTTCCVLMYGLGISYPAARRMLEEVRYVDLEGVLKATKRDDGSYTEAHELYVPEWEQEALRLTTFRFAAPVLATPSFYHVPTAQVIEAGLNFGRRSCRTGSTVG